MKSFIKLLFSSILVLFFAGLVNGIPVVDAKGSHKHNSFVTLNGKSLPKGNPIASDGKIHEVASSLLRLMYTTSESPKGTILLFPGGAYEALNFRTEGENIAKFFTGEGFDVAVLDYQLQRDSALLNAQKAYRSLKANQQILGLRAGRIGVVGISSGGHLAARMVQKLDLKEQPDDLILLSPSYLDETTDGTVFPAVMPPVTPTARLFTTFFVNDKKEWVKSGQEYLKIWKGYDGKASYYLVPDSVSGDNKPITSIDKNLRLAKLLTTFLSGKLNTEVSSVNPAAVAVAGYSPKRHAEKLALVAKEKYDLILMGNSITNNFEKPDYQPIWNQFFAPRKALNLGYSGYRTENIIWNIQNGELDGQSPKVIVLEIGTNNIDEKNYPTRHTAGQLAGGIETIVSLIRQKLPETKIIVMRCFPGCYGGPNPTSHRAILERASDLVSRLADGKHVFFCDVNHVFLNFDGSINHDMMPDWLHPSPAGAKLWAQAMEPLLSELMGDQSRDTEIPANTAIVPVTKLENDSYNWRDRHAAVLHLKDSINPEIVLIGNSITHFWGGEPRLKYADGRLRNPNGPKAWNSVFGNYRVLNMGFGWDRTQNVLWRLDHGELDGLHPQKVVLLIGTNNTSETQHARMNTASEIVEGIRAICLRVRSKVPGAKIILMKILPREESPTHSRRILIDDINKQLEVFAEKEHLTLVDIGPKMLSPNGTLTKEIAGDFCHPTEKGYQIWADEIRRFITAP